MPIVWDDEKTQTTPQKKIIWDDEVTTKPTQQPKSIWEEPYLQKKLLTGTFPITSLFPEKIKEPLAKKYTSEVVSPALHAGSAAVFDLPEYLIKRFAPQYMPPEQETLIGKGLRGAGEIAGFAKGAPLKVGEKLALALIPELAKETLKRKMLRGAITTGTAMATLSPNAEKLKEPTTILQETGKFIAPTERIVSGGAGAILGAGGEAISKVIPRVYRKLKTKIREGELFTPETKKVEEQIGRLKNISKETYTPQINAQQERITGLESKYTQVSKLAKEKYGSQIDLEKQNLKGELDNITENINKNKEKLEQTKTTLSEKSSVEAARKSWEFKKEASGNYGKAEDLIANNIEKGGGISRQAIQDKVINPARAEIEKDLITKGKPLAFFDDLEAKYGSGILRETNPEAKAVAKALGLKKGQLKNAGIDWSKVSKESQFQPTSGDETINIKEAFKDARDMHETLSATAKGEKALATPEDRAATIYLKHWNKFMEEISPEHKALQQAYKPIIEQKEFIGKTFKPGSVYERETGAKFYRDVAEKGIGIGERERLAAIEQGTPGFTKGIGEYSDLVKKAQNKIVNAEKAGETLKEKATKLSETKQQELSDMLTNKLKNFEDRLAKQTNISKTKKAELSDALKNRLSQLEKRKGFGQKEVVDVSRLAKKKVQGEKLKRIATLGALGLAGGGYFGKKFIYKLLSGGK